MALFLILIVRLIIPLHGTGISVIKWPRYYLPIRDRGLLRAGPFRLRRMFLRIPSISGNCAHQIFPGVSGAGHILCVIPWAANGVERSANEAERRENFVRCRHRRANTATRHVSAQQSASFTAVVSLRQYPPSLLLLMTLGPSLIILADGQISGRAIWQRHLPRPRVLLQWFTAHGWPPIARRKRRSPPLHELVPRQHPDHGTHSASYAVNRHQSLCYCTATKEQRRHELSKCRTKENDVGRRL